MKRRDFLRGTVASSLAAPAFASLAEFLPQPIQPPTTIETPAAPSEHREGLFLDEIYIGVIQSLSSSVQHHIEVTTLGTLKVDCEPPSGGSIEIEAILDTTGEWQKVTDGGAMTFRAVFRTKNEVLVVAGECWISRFLVVTDPHDFIRVQIDLQLIQPVNFFEVFE